MLIYSEIEEIRPHKNGRVLVYHVDGPVQNVNLKDPDDAVACAELLYAFKRHSESTRVLETRREGAAARAIPDQRR